MLKQGSAQWIWSDRAAGLKNSYVEFRGSFTLEDGATPLSLHISARHEYMLYLNGDYIGRGPSPCDADWQYYDTYDVSGRIVSGRNVIAAVCYHFGEKDIVTDQLQGEAGFIALLEHGVSGAPIFATGAGWKCRQSPRWSTQTMRINMWGGFKEIYLAGKEDGWEHPGYDDDGWEDAAVRAEACNPESPWPRLLPREIPFLHIEKVKPQSVLRVEDNFGVVRGAASFTDGHGGGAAAIMQVDASAPGAMPAVVYDFGREVVGRPSISIEAPRGGVLKLSYGESLELQHIDTFILKPGAGRLEPFGRRAFRFMKLSFAATPDPVTVTDVSFTMTHYAFGPQGTFACGDDQLERIWDVSVYTTLMNSHDHLEDCPWREKALWVVDAVVMGKIIYNTFGDTAMMRKCILQGARIQNEDGSIPGTGPEKNAMLLPDFCAYWLLGAYDYWRYTGDAAFVRELWPSLQRVTEWFGKQTDHTGLFANADRPGWWCFIDWTDVVDKRDKVAGISFLYARVLRSMSEMAGALQLHEEASRYESRRTKLLTDIRTHLWLEDKQLFADCLAGDRLSGNLSLQTNFLAVWCGIMSPEEAKYFLDEYYTGRKLPAIRGPFFQHIVLEVLLAEGRKEQALELIRSYWGEMLNRGATTWWETFNAASEACTIPSTYQGNTPTYLWEGPPVSLCHAWGASPAYMLPRLVHGVDISRLGSGVLEVAEPYAGLPGGVGEFPSRYGPIRIEWTSEAGTVSGVVRVPAGIRVTAPPSYPLSIVTEPIA